MLCIFKYEKKLKIGREKECTVLKCTQMRERVEKRSVLGWNKSNLYWSMPMFCKWYFSHGDWNIPSSTIHCCSNVLIEITESITLVIILDLIHLATWSDLPSFIKHIYSLPIGCGLHHSGWYFGNTKHNSFDFFLLQKGQTLLLIK